jgi:hypothetical protein
MDKLNQAIAMVKAESQRLEQTTEAATCRDHRLARYQQQRSQDHSKALTLEVVLFCTKKNRSGSESAVGEVEGGTTEESCLGRRITHC